MIVTEHKRSVHKNDLIELKKLFFKLLRFRFLFLGTSITAFTVVYFYNRYCIPVYTSHISILIDNHTSEKLESYIPNTPPLINQTKNNLFNEKLFLQSRIQQEKTIENLNFDLSYFEYKNFRFQPIYNPSLLKIEYDPNHYQLSNCLFIIQRKDPTSVYVRIKEDNENAFCFRPIDQKQNHHLSTEFKSDVFTINEWISGSGYRFRVVQINSDEEFGFRLNTNQQLIDYYHGETQVDITNGEQQTINISINGTLPERDRTFLDQFATTYLNRSIENDKESIHHTQKFVHLKLKEVTDSLRNFEERIQNFKQKNRLINLDFKQQQLFSHLTTVEADIAKEKLIKELYYQKLQSLTEHNHFDSSELNLSINQDNDILLNHIKQLEQLYTSKEIGLKSTHEKTLRLDIINEQIERTISLIEKELQERVRVSDKIIQEKTRELLKYESEIEHLPIMESKFYALEREFKLYETLYSYLEKIAIQVKIDEARVISNKKIIDVARTNDLMVSPTKKKNYFYASLFGIFIPIGSVVLLEFIRNKIVNLDELEDLTSIPVLGIISKSDVKASLAVHENPESQIAEMIRILRFELLFRMGSNNENGGKTILISSTIPGEGKTFTSVNLASSLASTGSRVLLLSMDLRKEKIARIFGINDYDGITEYLTCQLKIEDIIRKTLVPNLDIIPSGSVPPNPSELIRNSRTAELICELRSRYDFIIIDTPPLSKVSDGYELSKYGDFTLFIVRQNYTDKESINFINARHNSGIFQNMSIVMNDFDTQNTYGYRYGYYYKYGSYRKDN